MTYRQLLAVSGMGSQAARTCMPHTCRLLHCRISCCQVAVAIVAIAVVSTRPHTAYGPPSHYPQWMRNPISTKELASVALGCGNAGGAPATPQQLAMLQQQTSTTPTDTPSTPGAADKDKSEGVGAAQNDAKMPPMGVRISMTIGGRKLQLEGKVQQWGEEHHCRGVTALAGSY